MLFLKAQARKRIYLKTVLFFRVPVVDLERLWFECVEQDLHTHNLNDVDSHDRKMEETILVTGVANPRFSWTTEALHVSWKVLGIFLQYKYS